LKKMNVPSICQPLFNLIHRPHIRRIIRWDITQINHISRFL
jgi:hypothetical protein